KLEPPVPPARMPFGSGVAGAGLVEAETENISVGSALPGVVTQVNVKVGDQVKKDALLFRLDDRQLQAELHVRRANLKAAVAQLEKLEQMPRPEEVPSTEARMQEAQANLTNMEDQFKRAQAMYARRGISEEEMVNREQAARVAREQFRRAEADYKLLKAGAWSADKDVTRAQVEQMRAQVEQTEIELERLDVRALVDGEVLQVNIRPSDD